MNNKRILLVIGFVASIGIFGFLLYFFFFRDLLGGGAPANLNQPVGNFPQISNGNIGVINANNLNATLPSSIYELININAPTDVARGGLTNVADYGDEAVAHFVSGRGGPQWYDQGSGLFYRLDGANRVSLSDQKFFNVQNVTWSNDLNKAVLEYPDGSNIVYDFVQKKQVTLPKELEEFSFDSSGQSIAAKWIGRTSDENWLMVGGADGSGLRIVEPMGEEASNVQVGFASNNQIVALVREVQDARTQTVLPIGLQGENFKSFAVDGIKFQGKWAPDGANLLYNVANVNDNYGPHLWLTSGNAASLGASHLDIGLNTWASKCAFNVSATSIYCAVPTELPRGAGLYPELAEGIPDLFYRIDLLSGQKIPLAFPVGSQASYSASSLSLSSDESLLYFTDERTNRLHSIRLK